MPSAPKWLFDAVDLLMPKLPLVSINAVELLSPSLKKIQFKGDFKNLHFPVGAFVDFRVSETDARRYTVSLADPENGIIEMIVHLHGDGSGRHYMDSLKVGDLIDMNKPRGERSYYDPKAEKYVIFGDETSLGLACSFLPVLKQNNHQFLFYLEMDQENQHVPQQLGLENCVLFDKNRSFKNEDVIDDLPIFQTGNWDQATFVLTGNVSSAQRFKKVIKKKTKAKTYLHGYWLEGKRGL